MKLVLMLFCCATAVLGNVSKEHEAYDCLYPYASGWYRRALPMDVFTRAGQLPMRDKYDPSSHLTALALSDSLLPVEDSVKRIEALLVTHCAGQRGSMDSGRYTVDERGVEAAGIFVELCRRPEVEKEIVRLIERIVTDGTIDAAKRTDIVVNILHFLDEFNSKFADIDKATESRLYRRKFSQAVIDQVKRIRVRQEHELGVGSFVIGDYYDLTFKELEYMAVQLCCGYPITTDTGPYVIDPESVHVLDSMCRMRELQEYIVARAHFLTEGADAREVERLMAIANVAEQRLDSTR